MKRQPISEKAHSTKKTVLEAAAHILVKYGHEKFNTNVIAEKAGVSIGTLYQYYSHKDEILEDLMSEMMIKRQTRVKEALDVKSLTESSEVIIEKLISALFDFTDDFEAQLEMQLMPILFRINAEKNAIQKVIEMENLVKPLIKALLIVRRPNLVKRDLDVIIFIMSQSMRGVFLGSSLPFGREIPKKKLKIELKKLLMSYLDLAPEQEAFHERV